MSQEKQISEMDELEYWKWAAKEARNYAKSLEEIVRGGAYG